jgi:hypothetical protein
VVYNADRGLFSELPALGGWPHDACPITDQSASLFRLRPDALRVLKTADDMLQTLRGKGFEGTGLGLALRVAFHASVLAGPARQVDLISP